jgi:Ca2+-binding EF-hand superfamily protein
MNKYSSSALIIGSIVLSFSAQAKTDTNNDGFFSREELIASSHARIEKKFAQADANHDNKITMDELAGQKLSVAKAADADKDGVITLAEAKKHSEATVDKRMTKKDTDKDGKLSKEERQRKTS